MIEQRLQRRARQPAGGLEQRIEREGDVARLLRLGPIDQPHALCRGRISPSGMPVS